MTTSRRHLTGWVFLSPELHFIGHRIFRLRNSLHLLRLQWHRHWGRLISWVPICQSSGLMSLYVVIVCKCTSEYLRAPGFQDLQIPGFESPPGSWVQESSRFLGSQVLQIPGFDVLRVPGFNFCHLSSVICYLLFFPYSVIVIDWQKKTHIRVNILAMCKFMAFFTGVNILQCVKYWQM